MSMGMFNGPESAFAGRSLVLWLIVRPVEDPEWIHLDEVGILAVHRESGARVLVSCTGTNIA